MSIPQNLKYTKEHEWVRDNGDGTATVGITDFAQTELGDIVYVELNEAGESYSKDDVFGTVEAVKTVSELFMPVAAEVIEVNESLADEPEMVNDDPYEKGWMIKIKPDSMDDLETLLSAADYEEVIA